eukprot:symbB.v1.2.005973.t1/scaffold344.1/size224651/15
MAFGLCSLAGYPHLARSATHDLGLFWEEGRPNASRIGDTSIRSSITGGLPGRRWKGLVRTERLHCSAVFWCRRE